MEQPRSLAAVVGDSFCREEFERPERDSNPRQSVLQTDPLVHSGIWPGGESVLIPLLAVKNKGRRFPCSVDVRFVAASQALVLAQSWHSASI